MDLHVEVFFWFIEDPKVIEVVVTHCTEEFIKPVLSTIRQMYSGDYKAISSQCVEITQNNLAK